MNLWATVLAAGVIAFALKLAGYLVPQRALRGLRIARISTLLPIALLSALVVTQAFTTSNGSPTLDARAAAVAVAIIALLLRAPFIVVIILAAAAAAILRATGLAS